MQYPSLAEYSDALQLSLGIALSDPLLGRGTLRSRGPGQPVVRSGNFALTFEVVTDGRSYAVRCFHKPCPSLHTRYDAIGSHLRSVRNKCFVDFEFQPHGITTESGIYPIVRMDWAPGQTLAAFVAAHRADSGVLEDLRVSLREISRALHGLGIAHGDIQPTNMILQSAADLRLIDYDGMFVPQLAGLQSTELGQRNFQHSGRRSRHFDASLDSFAFSLLDLTLDALGRRPELWEQSDSDADAFILRAADIADPASSPAFSLLASVPGLEQRVRRFAGICAAPYEQVPTFEDFLAGRNLPTRPVVFTGSADLPLRREYVPACDVVDATNFAQCCSHVGDRVEMIGRIVRVGTDSSPPSDTPCLRVEFANQSHDMACLKIWPEALASRQNVPDATWVGQWVRAVGLVEPVHSSAESGAGHRKDVAISITDSSQLHRLTATEARYCLRGQRGRTRPALDTTAGVKTDRVVADVVPRPLSPPTPAMPPVPVPTPRPQVATAPARPTVPMPSQPRVATAPARPSVPLPSRPQVATAQARPAVPMPSQPRVATTPARPLVHSPPPPTVVTAAASPPAPTAFRPNSAGGRTWLGWLWPVAAVLAAVAIYSFVDRPTPPAPETPRTGSRDTRQPMPAGATAAHPALHADTSRLESLDALTKARLPIPTLAGALDIGSAGEPDARPAVMLDGVAVPGLRDDAVSLTHRAVFSDREIVVGFTQCNGALVPCGVQQPFWLALRTGVPPLVRRTKGLWVGRGTGAGAVVASGKGVQVDLGAWNGERRSATLLASGEVAVARTREPRRSLSRADCATVIKAAESCASSRDCRTFKSSARPIPPSRWQRLSSLYHESTGLDAIAFRALCVRSCELGLTPSDAFIQRRVCSGAAPDQWPRDNPAAGL